MVVVVVVADKQAGGHNMRDAAVAGLTPNLRGAV
jgi:hypothetical protein